MIPMKLWSFLIAGALALTGCAGTPPQAQGDDRVAVVASFYPLQFIAERVGGDRVTVTTLTQPGIDPHDLELAPRQVVSISRADLVVYQRGLQPGVDRVIATEQPATVLEVTTIVPLHEGGAAADGHDHEGGDPHTWLDPTAMVAYAKAMAETLAKVDPAHAADYTSRADRLAAELTALDASFTSGLASCDRRTFITAHEAFGYLAERYELTQVAIAGLAPDAEPSPARVAEVQRVARETGATTIFYETLTSPAVAKAVAGDLGLLTDVLDPLEGITADSRGTDYVSVMTANLAALRTANGCR
jgi:zinc transport system substrate-binding protein